MTIEIEVMTVAPTYYLKVHAHKRPPNHQKCLEKLTMGEKNFVYWVVDMDLVERMVMVELEGITQITLQIGHTL